MGIFSFNKTFSFNKNNIGKHKALAEVYQGAYKHNEKLNVEKIRFLKANMPEFITKAEYVTYVNGQIDILNRVSKDINSQDKYFLKLIERLKNEKNIMNNTDLTDANDTIKQVISLAMQFSSDLENILVGLSDVYSNQNKVAEDLKILYKKFLDELKKDKVGNMTYAKEYLSAIKTRKDQLSGLFFSEKRVYASARNVYKKSQAKANSFRTQIEKFVKEHNFQVKQQLDKQPDAIGVGFVGGLAAAIVTFLMFDNIAVGYFVASFAGLFEVAGGALLATKVQDKLNQSKYITEFINT